MKYCVKYDSRMEDKFGQIDTVIFTKEELGVNPALEQFRADHPNTRIVLQGTMDDFLRKEELAIAKKLGNVTFMFIEEELATFVEDTSHKAFLADIKQNGIPYFFDIIATKWDVLIGMIDLAPHEIIIGEELGFWAPVAAAKCHDAGIKIGFYPNIAQNGAYGTKITDFFVLPEDMELYEGVIDYAYLYVTQFDYSRVIYEIYAEDKEWNDSGLPLIKGISDSFNTKLAADLGFGASRFNCHKRCQNVSECKLCQTYVNVANEFIDVNTQIEKL